MQASATISPSGGQLSTIVAESNLTELQLLYWIGHQLRPSTAHFNNAFSFTFSTPICPQLFQQAFATAVSQYDALRTVIQEQEGIPLQHILLEPPALLTFVDLSAEPDPDAAAVAWQEKQVQRPFQLEHCLYDSALLKLNDQKFVWFINQHHLITDASSFFLLAETMLAHYADLRQGEPLAATEKPTFARYAASLQRQQSSSRAAKSREFWHEKLGQKPDKLCFYGRNTHKNSSQVQRWTHNLGPKQTAQLIAVAEDVDLGTTTLEMRQFCLTATLFFSLMHQLTGNSQLGFVTTVHNRATQVNRQTVGVLMELCPLVVTINPDETFCSLMQKVAAEMKLLLLHYRHGASRAASDLALDVMFTFVHRPSLMHDGQTVTQDIVHPGCGSEQLALHVHHLADSNSYELYLDFQQDIFDGAEQEHAMESLKQLITTLLQNPEASITQDAIPWPIDVSGHQVVSENGRGNGRYRPIFTPPSTFIETQLQQIWQEILGLSAIGVHDDFFALGGESLRAMSFLSKFEAETGHYLPLSALLNSSTIASLAQQIETQAPPETIVTLQLGAPAKPPLFLIPGAAGNALALGRVAQHLNPNQPIYTFQTPRLEAENFPEAEIESLATYYLSAMQTVKPHGPYYLGGYSAGGILAYEVAQRLRKLGEVVSFLAIIDMPAPNPAYKVWRQLCHSIATLLHISAMREEAVYLWGRDFWNRIAYFLGRGLEVWLGHYGRLLQRFWRMSLKRKWVYFRRQFGQKKEVNATDNNNVLRDMDSSSLTDPRARTLFDIYDRAARKYLPQPYDGRLTLLRCPLGSGRKEIRSPYPHYGWQPLVRHLETYIIQANGHLALLQEPAVTHVGQILQTTLSQALNKDEK